MVQNVTNVLNGTCCWENIIPVNRPCRHHSLAKTVLANEVFPAESEILRSKGAETRRHFSMAVPILQNKFPVEIRFASSLISFRKMYYVLDIVYISLPHTNTFQMYWNLQLMLLTDLESLLPSVQYQSYSIMSVTFSTVCVFSFSFLSSMQGL